MYLDTHCHLSTIKEKEIDLTFLLENLVKEKRFFAALFVFNLGTLTSIFKKILESGIPKNTRFPLRYKNLIIILPNYKLK